MIIFFKYLNFFFLEINNVFNIATKSIYIKLNFKNLIKFNVYFFNLINLN